MQKPLLIFDFFGVIVEEVAHKWLHDRMDKEKAKHIISTIFVAVDTGKITPEECFIALEEITNVSAQQIEEDWLNIGQLRKDTYDFITSNKDKYHIVLLSNAGTSFINKFFARDPLEALFLKKFISSELRMAKPDPNIFKHVVKHAGVNYTYAVMIDDAPSNIAAAKGIGIHGVLFTNMTSVERELDKIALSEK